MASPNVSELLTTCLNNYSGEIGDNVTKNNALLLWLSKKGNVVPVQGGATIRQELAYQENNSFKWYSGYDPLVTSQDDVLSAGEWSYAQCAVTVSISGLEVLQNAESKWRIHDLLKSRISVANNTLKNNVSLGLYSDGTGDGGKQIIGLKTAVPDDPTASVTFGGINRATYTFWQNNYFNADDTAGAHGGGAAATAANFITYMNTLVAGCIRGTDVPNLWIMGSSYWGLFQGGLQTIQRITGSDEGDAGFASLAYSGGGKRADVVLDGGFGGGALTTHAWCLNTDYLFFRPHAQRNFVPLDPERYSTNQDAVVRIIGFAGALTASAMFPHGVMFA